MAKCFSWMLSTAKTFLARWLPPPGSAITWQDICLSLKILNKNKQQQQQRQKAEAKYQNERSEHTKQTCKTHTQNCRTRQVKLVVKKILKTLQRVSTHTHTYPRIHTRSVRAQKENHKHQPQQQRARARPKNNNEWMNRGSKRAKELQKTHILHASRASTQKKRKYHTHTYPRTHTRSVHAQKENHKHQPPQQLGRASEK